MSDDPFFIVGFGRSGTKLLGAILNENPQVGIHVGESPFLVHIVQHFGDSLNLNRSANVDLLWKKFSESAFFQQRQILGDAKNIEKEEFLRILNASSWRAIIESIFRAYVPPGKNENYILGDRTPKFMNHVTMIREIFPKSKFIHIVRDPRDCCLSWKKTLNRSVLRTATNWRRSIELFGESTSSLTSDKDVMEVRYESLLLSPEKVVKQICFFLGCDFKPNMLLLSKSPEEYGAARGSTRVVKNNCNKFFKELPSHEIRRIEEIAYPEMINKGYKIYFADGYRPMGKFHYKYESIIDIVRLLRFHVVRLGYFDGVRFFYKAFVKPRM